jgi:hypothetical protein
MRYRIILSLLMSFILSLLMTAWITFINVGLTQTLVSKWVYAFLLVLPLAFIISFCISRRVADVSHKLNRKLGQLKTPKFK